MSSSWTPTTTIQPVTHTMSVGKSGYTIEPDVVLAEVGDYIEYAFYPRNHTIVRADFEHPCVPYELINTRPGFYSGWKPVDAILDDPPTYTVRVNDTEPIFVYCSGPHACKEYGMVAVVNPAANTSLDVHRAAAKQSDFTLQPGDKWPCEGPCPEDIDETNEYGTSSTSAAPTVTVTPTITATSGAASTTGAAVTGSHSGLAPGAIAGIAIGAAAVALAAAIALWICGRRSRRGTDSPNTNGTWYLGGKNGNGGYQSGAATPATMPPAYGHNPHGLPIMTHNKAYPGVNTSVMEHYGPPTGSPPPQMMHGQISPNYMQQNFPPHILDPAAFNHPGYIPAGLAQNPPQPHQIYEYRPEIYSGTPAPRSPPPTTTLAHGFQPGSGPTGTSAYAPGRNSMSQSGGGNATSRGGSPDILHEMNALRSQVGTVNQGAVQSVPQREPIGFEIKRLE